MFWLSSVLEVYLFLLTLVKASFLLWIYQNTRQIAVIVYLLYSVIYPIFLQWKLTPILNNIQNNNLTFWLGETSGERSHNFLMLTRTIDGTIYTLIFVWMLYSLLIWSKR
jgi:hypothetical protein